MTNVRTLAVILLLMSPVAAGEMADQAQPPIVVVLSWDGMRHDYPDRDEFPALNRIARDGVRAGRLTPVFPSSTFPGHVSMATGTYPDVHGIVDNVFLDREKGRYAYDSDANWLDAEPLWIAAERQGVKTATYFWVGSETDWRGQGTSYRIAPFDNRRPESVKVDQILAWLALPEAERPRLVMSYWAGADSVGHDEGPDSAEVTEQIHRQDAQLARLLAGIDDLGLWARTTLIIVSDHGMTPVTHYLDLSSALEDAGIDAQVIGAAVAQVHLEAPVEDARMESVLSVFLAQVPGAAFYRREDLPAGLRLKRASRIGEWVVVLPPPWRFLKPSGIERALIGAAVFLGGEFGMHGYDPALPDMGGVFLAMGSSVPPDAALTEVRQIDLAATVAKILGIEPPSSSEGASIW